MVRLIQAFAALIMFLAGLALVVGGVYSGWNFNWDTDKMTAIGMLLMFFGGVALASMSDGRHE